MLYCTFQRCVHKLNAINLIIVNEDKQTNKYLCFFCVIASPPQTPGEKAN